MIVFSSKKEEIHTHYDVVELTHQMNVRHGKEEW